MNEHQLLEAARRGDENAFAALTEPHRRALHAHGYRMLGSLHDAEDALQETMLRAWRGLASFEGRSSLRSWLYSIATNVCLRAIERRPKRVLPIDYGPPAGPHDGLGAPVIESVWVEPYPDERLGIEDGLAGPEARYERRESVELAFIAALQHPAGAPARRAHPARRARVLGARGRRDARHDAARRRSALQRAHKAADERLPERSQQAMLGSLDDQGVRAIVEGFVDAWERADVDAVVAMLASDAAVTMPPIPTWDRGREAVTTFLETVVLTGDKRWRVVPVRANGQLAFGRYIWDEDRRTFAAHSISVLTLEGWLIAEFTTFLDPELLPRFGLAMDFPSGAYPQQQSGIPAAERPEGEEPDELDTHPNKPRRHQERPDRRDHHRRRCEPRPGPRDRQGVRRCGRPGGRRLPHRGGVSRAGRGRHHPGGGRRCR
jgi:RNA polymerase sigma-70 factor (ECF subfamily)